MMENSPEGSPTPRKTSAGGVVLPSNAAQQCGQKHWHHKSPEHPSFGDDLRPAMKSLSLVNKVYDPSHLGFRSPALPKMSLPSPHVNPDPTDFLTSADSPITDFFRDNNSRSGMLSHCVAGAEGPEDNVVDRFPGQTVSPSPSSKDSSDREKTTSTSGSVSTIETSAESAEVSRLREELFHAQAKLAHVKDELATRETSFAHPSITPFSDAALASKQPYGLGINTDLASHAFSQQHDFTPHSSQDSNDWARSMACNNGLMEGSLPELGTMSAPLPQLPFGGPGVIGQTDHGTLHRIPSSGSQRVDTNPTHFTHPIGQVPFHRDMHHPAYQNAFAKENLPWGFNSQGIVVDSMAPSRSATPASSFGSLPPSLVSSTASLPMIHQRYPGIGPRSQSASLLSPMAAEFNALPPTNYMAPSPWNPQPREEPQQRYMTMAEPLNYRQMIEKNFNGPYKPFVDRIVYHNDQQSSIALQHKLKVASIDQKYDVIQAIIDQAQPLMINRFGNFLVQRCFEHGTPEQIIAIARAIRGHTLNLSMDAFGCHVVQKAFDYAPEEYKALMVHELLCNIPETVIHRYACHVWQKLFELRWNGSPPQIMKYVNEALRGMWHEVALGETGSLVVQNIFENCLEDDKRPCINEVLASIDTIAHGQFGNWCIQHICEHGAPADQTRAVDHILRFATEYSIDQYASKVVEKCLKIGGPDFLDRYLDRVCEARPDRPRMPLIDIAGDQYGNYLVQFILQNADPHRREVVGTHLRKHMVSLRGSKYGSRVAMFCNNPGYQPRASSSYGATLDRAPGGSSRPVFDNPAPWENARPSRYPRGGYERSFDRGSDRFDRSFDRSYDRGGYDRSFDRGF